MIEFLKFTPKCYAYTGGETRGNLAFIELESSLIFVDSGMDPITTKEARTEAEKITGKPVKTLILTHYHSDHILGNQVFEDCQIISSEETSKNIEMVKREMWTEEGIKKAREQRPEYKEKWKGLKIVLPNQTFKEQLVIEEIPLHIIRAQGHTSGSSYIYLPEENTVITGDLLFSESYPYGGDPTANIYQWIEALQNIVDLQPNMIIPGHGPVTSVKEIKKHIDYFKKLVQKIEEKVKEGITQKKLPTVTDFPDFPYKVDERRFKLMLQRVYDTAIETLKG